jgi:hypothetical protein
MTFRDSWSHILSVPGRSVCEVLRCANVTSVTATQTHAHPPAQCVEQHRFSRNATLVRRADGVAEAGERGSAAHDSSSEPRSAPFVDKRHFAATLPAYEERRPGYAVSMCRLVAAALVLCAFGAAPAGAATVGVYDGPDLSAVALAGPDAVVLRQASGERSQLVAVPRGGGKPQTVLTVDRMNFVFEDESRRLAASAARVALIAEIEDAQDRTVEWRVYSGPPRGPVGVVRALPIREA